MKKLEKDSPIPLYYQLYSFLLKDIRDGTLKPGDMIPPEAVLMRDYDISRATVRHAVLDLAREGYVVRIKSKGTIVKDSSYSVGFRNKIKGFSAISREHGVVNLKNKVLEAKVMRPPNDVKKALGLADGETAFYLKRVRGMESEPNVYVEDWVNYKLCEGIEKVDFSQNSLYDTLETLYDVSPCRAVRTFDCCYANSAEQLEELHVQKNTALLRLISYVYDQDDRPLEYAVAIINGKYTMDV